MADTLTQEQIDALLNQALSGEVIETAAEDEKEQVKEYDFRSPKKFTKEKIRSLETIFESYARSLSSYLTGLLRLYCKVSLISIEEQRYFEYNNALPDYVIMGLVDLGINSQNVEEFTTILQLSNSLTFTMIDRLLGGRGVPTELDRDFTELETSVMKKVTTDMAKMMEEPWSNYVALHPNLVGMETNSRVISTVGYDDTMMIIALEVTVNDENKSVISVCMPAINLDEIMMNYVTKNQRTVKKNTDPKREADRRESIMNALNQSSLTITAVLSETQLQMSDVLHLQVNDIIPLDKNIGSNIVLRIGDKDWFDGKPGIYNNKKAVKIENVYRIEV
ncbi:MAG: flagellar motor switch protein FliM [Ruminiclostridium sp.]|nr:flagellar motor switch protein FliM [Ruminiclostridium sp.]MDE6724809.1 flagellar motor switch protein FliM [Ruminiclostridium sp.]